MNIPFDKVISIIHNTRFAGLPTHYPSIAAWDSGCIDILKFWNSYKQGKEDVGLYINIPICRTKCKFCFLDVMVDTGNVQNLYISALIEEFKILSEVINKSNYIKSVYIGGGTPNILSEKNLEKLLKNLHTYFNLKKCLQISIESNPDFWTEAKINILKRYGVQLAIMGIQSFDPAVSLENRRFQMLKNIEKTIVLMKEYGIKINIDLLVGISDEKTFFSDIKRITELMPDQVHINRLKPLIGNFNKEEKERLISLQNKGFEILLKKGYLQLDEDSAGLNGFKGNIQGDPDFQIYSSLIAAGLMSIGHVYGRVRYQNVYDLSSYSQKIKSGILPVLRYCFIDEKDEITHYCLNKVLRDKLYLDDLHKKFSKSSLSFILEKLSMMHRKKLLDFKKDFYSARKNIYWYEITKNFYSEEYLLKIAKRYKLVK